MLISDGKPSPGRLEQRKYMEERAPWVLTAVVVNYRTCPTCLWRTWVQHPSLHTKTEWAKSTCSKPPTTCLPKGNGWTSGLGKRRVTAQLASVCGVCSEAWRAQGVHHTISVTSVARKLYSLLCMSLKTWGQWTENQRKLWYWTRERKEEVREKQ